MKVWDKSVSLCAAIQFAFITLAEHWLKERDRERYELLSLSPTDAAV